MKDAICIHCKKHYRYYPSDKSVGKFCSLRCYHQHIRNNRRRRCVKCGKYFTYYASNKNRKYCSKQCWATRAQVSVVCALCGKKFMKPKHTVNDTNFCSKVCQLKYMSLYPYRLGKKHSQKTKVKIRAKQAAWKRTDKYKEYILRQRKKGKNSPTKFKTGHKFPQEVIEKIREARIKQVFPTKRTSIERVMEHALREYGFSFVSQQPLLNICVADFFIKPNTAIFCDGDYWHNLPNYRTRDRRITNQLERNGYNVYRFWEHEINQDVHQCMKQIKYANT